MILTLLGTGFLFAVRLAGGAVAAFFERSLRDGFKKSRATSSRTRSACFMSGLDAMRSWSDFAVVASLSLSMWLLIACAYFDTCRAFVASPQLANVAPSKCVLLMVASGAASVLQLPVIGWFSQIGAVAVAVHGHRRRHARGCNCLRRHASARHHFSASFPSGLIWARFEHVSLRKVTLESEHAEEVITESGEADTATVP